MNDLYLSQLNTCTADGHEIVISVPALDLKEAERAAKSKADGIGLLSTDFIYENRPELPGEDEQYQILRHVADIMGSRPVTVRTLQLPPSHIPALKNSGLPDECRGIRMGLAIPEILQTQLKAITRAGVAGNFRLLLPVVTDVSEVIKVKEILSRVQSELEGPKSYASIQLGVDIEIPAAAVMAQVISFEVSFFYIGEKLKAKTLVISETGAAPGLNGNILHHYAPSFLFQISNLAEEVGNRRKSLCLTAPLAGMPAAIPLLVAMGVNELVMEPGQVEQARRIISRLTVPKAKLVAAKAMSFWAPDEIQRYAEECLPRFLK